MEAIDIMGLYFQKVKQFAKFMVKYDDELDELSYTGSEEDLKAFINKIKIDYESKFNSSFIEDLKELIEKMLQSKAARKAKTPKDIKKVKGLRRVLDVISDKAEGHEEEDPYGEEEWNDDNANKFKLFDILRDGRRMSPGDFVNHIKELVLNKNVSFLEEDKDYLIAKFRTRIVVKDVELIDTDYIYAGVIFIDGKGNEFIPSSREPINILD